MAVPEHLFDERADDWVLLIVQDFIDENAPALVGQLVQVQVMDHVFAVALVDVEREVYLQDYDAEGPGIAVVVAQLDGLQDDVVVFHTACLFLALLQLHMD